MKYLGKIETTVWRQAFETLEMEQLEVEEEKKIDGSKREKRSTRNENQGREIDRQKPSKIENGFQSTKSCYNNFFTLPFMVSPSKNREEKNGEKHINQYIKWGKGTGESENLLKISS